jgi:hypothetical protein
MPASLADLAQLSERLGVALDPESADGVRLQGVLDDVSAFIRAEGLPWADPPTAPDIVVAICLAVALRAWKNPEGAQQASVGDVSVTYAGAQGGSIFLLKHELRAIRKAAGRSAMGSIPLTIELQAGGDLRWAPTEGDPIPLGPWPWEEN